MKKTTIYDNIILLSAVLMSAGVASAAEVTGTVSGGVGGSVGGTLGGTVGGGGTIGGTVGGGPGSSGGGIVGTSGGSPGGGSVLGASTGPGSGSSPTGQVLGASTFNPGLPRTGMGGTEVFFNISGLFLCLVIIFSALFLMFRKRKITGQI